MKLVLYNNTDDKNKLIKTLSNGKEINVNIPKTFAFDSMNLKLRFDGGFDYNYLFIEKLNRYYFIVNKNYIGSDLVEIAIKCDLLMTFRNDLLKCVGMVTTTNTTNNYSSKISPTYDTRLKSKTYIFPNSFTDTPINVLVVANSRVSS